MLVRMKDHGEQVSISQWGLMGGEAGKGLWGLAGLSIGAASNPGDGLFYSGVVDPWGDTRDLKGSRGG